MPVVSKSIIINTPIGHLFKIIADFERYPEFLDEMKESKVLEKRGDIIEASFKLSLITDLEYVLRFHLKRPSRIEWKMLKGQMMRSNEGFWELKEVDRGTTEATYSMDVEFGLLVPKQVTSILLKKNLPAMLNAFKKRAEGTYKG